MISIIVPVYNVERYLDECVESIISNANVNIEVILVDDGSTDSSSAKCDKWATLDARVKTYHKQNGGLMSAWKYGVLHSNGDYVGFVDSDDWVDNNMFSVLYEHISRTNSDLVVCGLVKEFVNTGLSKPEKLLLSTGVYESKEIEEKINPILIASGMHPPRGLSPNRVTKLFKKEKLLSILEYCDENVSMGEDLLTTFAYISQCKKICIINDFYPYHYRIHSESMVARYSHEKYSKIRSLSNAMKRVNDSLSKYDFSSQIANDYIQLILSQMEQEILFSHERYRDLKYTLKSEFINVEFQSALKACDRKKLSKKHKLYIFLMRHSLYIIFVLMRKSKR